MSFLYYILGQSYSGGLPNRIDDSYLFVKQQYNDCLSREPDTDGEAFWQKQIDNCGADAACVAERRAGVAEAFFVSTEFQETGFWTARFYRAPSNRQPRFAEFLPDAQRVGQNVAVNAAGWQDQLEANKQSFADAWTQRANFKSLFDGKSNADYVRALLGNAGIVTTPEYPQTLISDLDAGRKTRAQVLRAIVDSKAFAQQEFNRTFVLMQYFCYLRRNPDDAPDGNFDGYNFWLKKPDAFQGDYHRAEMVKAFINSSEYRKRFGSQ